MKKVFLDILLVILCIICIGSLSYVIYYQYTLKQERDEIDEIRRKKEQRQEQLLNLEENVYDLDLNEEDIIPYKESLEMINSGILLAIDQNNRNKEKQEKIIQYKELLFETERNILLSIRGCNTQQDKDDMLVKYKEILKDTNVSFLTEMDKYINEEEWNSALLKYQKIFNQINNELPKNIEQVQNSNINRQKVAVDYQELYNENADFVGWVSIDGTKIDYPVMETPDDPLFYEHHDWNKKYSSSGLPFIDAQCNKDSENTIIYAHNMRSGAMFGTLKEYKKEAYFKQHPIIKYDTLYEEGEYQIIGVVLTKVYYNNDQKPGDFVFYNYIELDSEEQFNKYIDFVKDLSLYETGETAQYGDKLLTLSTCAYHIKDGRIIVVAKKIS